MKILIIENDSEPSTTDMVRFDLVLKRYEGGRTEVIRSKVVPMDEIQIERVTEKGRRAMQLTSGLIDALVNGGRLKEEQAQPLKDAVANRDTDTINEIMKTCGPPLHRSSAPSEA